MKNFKGEKEKKKKKRKTREKDLDEKKSSLVSRECEKSLQMLLQCPREVCKLFRDFPWVCYLDITDGWISR